MSAPSARRPASSPSSGGRTPSSWRRGTPPLSRCAVRWFSGPWDPNVSRGRSIAGAGCPDAGDSIFAHSNGRSNWPTMVSSCLGLAPAAPPATRRLRRPKKRARPFWRWPRSFPHLAGPNGYSGSSPTATRRGFVVRAAPDAPTDGPGDAKRTEDQLKHDLALLDASTESDAVKKAIRREVGRHQKTRAQQDEAFKQSPGAEVVKAIERVLGKASRNGHPTKFPLPDGSRYSMLGEDARAVASRWQRLVRLQIDCLRGGCSSGVDRSPPRRRERARSPDPRRIRRRRPNDGYAAFS